MKCQNCDGEGYRLLSSVECDQCEGTGFASEAACQKCGECCKHIGTPPFMPDEIQSLPADAKSVRTFYFNRDINRGEFDHSCYFWSPDKGCLIHEHKPEVCKAFLPGSMACRGYRLAKEQSCQKS